MPKRLPIVDLEKFTKKHGLRQTILLAWDGERSHCVTYGVDAEDCDQAAQGGELLKQHLGWPEWKAFPNRVRKLMTQNSALILKVGALEDQVVSLKKVVR